jgi:uncharacterized protein YrrD
MDRKAREIIGLPVITYDRGNKIYDIEDMILDPERRQVLALIVQERAAFHSARAIPFGRITAIGPDVVIVPDGKVVMDVNRDAVLKKLDETRIVVRGLRVITDDGRKLGLVDDMAIDDHTGEIKGFYVSIGKVLNVTQGNRWLPIDKVLQLGQRVMYVPADVAADFEQQLGGWAGALDQAGDKVRTVGAKANDGLLDVGNKARVATTNLDLTGRTANFAVGKTAQSTVRDAEGTVIVAKGDVVTQEQVDAARQAGRMPQLLMAAGANASSDQAGKVQDQLGQSLDEIRDEARELWGRLTGNYGQAANRADDRAIQRRLRDALGRPVTRVILDENDHIILNTGDIITNRAIERAEEAGVLDLLASSVYFERPKLTLEDLKGPRSGEASLERENGATPGSGADADRSATTPETVTSGASTGDTAPIVGTPRANRSSRQ